VKTEKGSARPRLPWNLTEAETMAAGNGFAPGWQTWHQEWSRFKEHMLTLLKPQINFESLTPRQRLVLEYMEREGVSPEALLLVWDKFRAAPGIPTLKILSALVRNRPLLLGEWPQRVHVLVGPHGVGKTSTVLRLALEFKREGARRICLANADTDQAKGRIFPAPLCRTLRIRLPGALQCAGLAGPQTRSALVRKDFH
jgi:flagellar biosynthesis protein FlhF